jgi:hypothetical protein
MLVISTGSFLEERIPELTFAVHGRNTPISAL